MPGLAHSILKYEPYTLPKTPKPTQHN